MHIIATLETQAVTYLRAGEARHLMEDVAGSVTSPESTHETRGCFA